MSQNLGHLYEQTQVKLPLAFHFLKQHHLEHFLLFLFEYLPSMKQEYVLFSLLIVHEFLLRLHIFDLHHPAVPDMENLRPLDLTPLNCLLLVDVYEIYSSIPHLLVIQHPLESIIQVLFVIIISCSHEIFLFIRFRWLLSGFHIVRITEVYCHCY